MHSAKFSEDTLRIFCRLIGQKFEYFECGVGALEWHRTYGNVRLNFEQESIELDNTQKVFNLFEFEEEVAYLTCQTVDRSIPFLPYVIENSTTIEVKATVLRIELIEERIVRMSDRDELVFDLAVIFHTDHGPWMFSHDGIWFDEDIAFSSHDDFESICPLSKSTKAWKIHVGEENSNSIEVTRRRIEIMPE